MFGGLWTFLGGLSLKAPPYLSLWSDVIDCIA